MLHRPAAETSTLRLGLIGDNIAASQAPRLHRLAGRLTGRAVSYDLLIPRERGMEFDALFEACRAGGWRGLNITYPYKERVTAKVRIDDPLVAAMGAVNTVVFTTDEPRGFNTDHTGFISAYRAVLGEAAPGKALMIGAGGVGRAVAFALVKLGLTDLAIADRNPAQVEGLAAALRAVRPDLSLTLGADAAALAKGCAGLVNCTPVGMVGYGGTPLPRGAMRGAVWAFDAVYTPVDTEFLRDAAAEGLAVISGYELFFGQGVDAWAIFSGTDVDPAALRAALAEPEPAP